MVWKDIDRELFKYEFSFKSPSALVSLWGVSRLLLAQFCPRYRSFI